MTDFTALTLNMNSGVANDTSPNWATVLAFGTAGVELRACASGAGAAGTASASWPPYLRPASTAVIPEMWGFTADTTGVKVNTYDGTAAHYNQFRINWDVNGTFASAPILSAWANNTYPAAAPGNQTVPDGSAVVNGSADTSNTSYMKGNAYGFGYSGGQQTPAANAAGTLAVTTGSGGAATTTTGAWLATWASLQAATSWIANGATPTATTAGFWYFVLALYTGPGMSGGMCNACPALQ